MIQNQLKGGYLGWKSATNCSVSIFKTWWSPLLGALMGPREPSEGTSDLLCQMFGFVFLHRHPQRFKPTLQQNVYFPAVPSTWASEVGTAGISSATRSSVSVSLLSLLMDDEKQTQRWCQPAATNTWAPSSWQKRAQASLCWVAGISNIWPGHQDPHPAPLQHLASQTPENLSINEPAPRVISSLFRAEATSKQTLWIMLIVCDLRPPTDAWCGSRQRSHVSQSPAERSHRSSSHVLRIGHDSWALAMTNRLPHYFICWKRI